MSPDVRSYNKFSDIVYTVDPLKKATFTQKVNVGKKKYKILDISRNGTYGNKNQYGVPNHMQAITVALNYIGADYAEK